jgi:hypothetical protein
VRIRQAWLKVRPLAGYLIAALFFFFFCIYGGVGLVALLSHHYGTQQYAEDVSGDTYHGLALAGDVVQLAAGLVAGLYFLRSSNRLRKLALGGNGGSAAG